MHFCCGFHSGSAGAHLLQFFKNNSNSQMGLFEFLWSLFFRFYQLQTYSVLVYKNSNHVSNLNSRCKDFGCFSKVLSDH